MFDCAGLAFPRGALELGKLAPRGAHSSPVNNHVEGTREQLQRILCKGMFALCKIEYSEPMRRLLRCFWTAATCGARPPAADQDARPARVNTAPPPRPASHSGFGESSGATSYHLRQLAHYGFIVEAEGMGTRRQRWWRAAHRTTSFDLTGDVGDEEQTLGLEYLRGVAAYNCAAIVDWVDGLAHQPKEWSEASTISDWLLRLTPTQTSELMAELTATLERYRSEVSDTAEGEQPSVIVQLQVLPRLGPESGA